MAFFQLSVYVSPFPWSSFQCWSDIDGLFFFCSMVTRVFYCWLWVCYKCHIKYMVSPKCKARESRLKWDNVKAGLCTVDWTVDWDLDRILYWVLVLEQWKWSAWDLVPLVEAWEARKDLGDEVKMAHHHIFRPVILIEYPSVPHSYRVWRTLGWCLHCHNGCSSLT